MSMLPVRPLPYAGEAIQGYALRLCQQNGWDSFTRLLSATKRNPLMRLHVDNRTIADVLYAFTGHADVNDAKVFMPGGSGVFGRHENAAFRYFEIERPHVCPECLREDGKVRSEWTHLPHTHCVHHKRRLISECPHCGQPLKWAVSLLHGACPHCSDQLATDGGQSEVPVYQRHFDQLDTRAQVRFLEDLSKAAQRALRPYDQLIDQAKRPPRNVEDWEVVLTMAYNMLTDYAFLDGWAASCQIHRRAASALGASAIYAPITELATTVSSDWAIASWVPSEDTQTANPRNLDTFLVSPSPSRRPIAKHHAGIDVLMRYQVNMPGASRVLGLPLKTFQALANDGWIPTVNGGRVTKGARFDLLSFINHLDNLAFLPSDDGTVRLQQMEPVFDLFAAEESDAVEAILSGSLPVFLDDQGHTFAERLRVKPDDLEESLRLRLRLRANTPSNKLTLAEVRNMLRLTGPEIRKLCSEGALKDADEHQRFLVSDVLALMDSYWIMSCWVAKNGGSTKEIRKQLRAEKLRPIAGTPIYERSAQLHDVVGRLEGPEEST